MYYVNIINPPDEQKEGLLPFPKRGSDQVPVISPFYEEDENFGVLVDAVDGLLLSGGVDINPILYGEKKIEGSPETHSPERDKLEPALIRLFLEKEKPILGICRGCQMINVFFGGTLYQDIPTEIPSSLCHSDPKLDMRKRYETLMHDVILTEKTVLASYFLKKDIAVNSLHHQAIKRVASGFVVNAIAKDGVIEGIESEDTEKNWIFGVQWHPEGMAEKFPEQKIILEKFIDAAKKKMT